MNPFFTYLLTVIVPLFFSGNSVINSKPKTGKFFSKEYTDVIKGLCCLVVVYVHVIPERGNIIQDAIGSFAYVAVTFFFLVSAYGMIAGIERKQNYLRNFWRNRLVSLLIPCFLVNVFAFIFNFIRNGYANFAILSIINSYVIVLLQWCIWFYIVELCRKRWFKDNKKITDLILIGGVVASSLFLYFFVDAEVSAEAGWCFERMGLVWGILLYRYFDQIDEWMSKSRLLKVVFFTLLGAALGICYLKYKTVYFWGAYLLKIILGFSLLILLFTATSNRKFGDEISKWLGSISYEVYLSHGIVLGLLNYIIDARFDSGLFLFLAMLCILLLSSVIHSIGKPIIKALRI